MLRAGFRAPMPSDFDMSFNCRASGHNSWGFILATPAAPFSILGLSPALIFIVLGIVLAQVFFAWLRKRKVEQKPQLWSLEVIDTAEEKTTTMCMATMLFIGTAANFLIPLYIQIVQGRSRIQTSLSIIPAGRMPGFRPGDMPVGYPQEEKARTKKQAAPAS